MGTRGRGERKDQKQPLGPPCRELTDWGGGDERGELGATRCHRLPESLGVGRPGEPGLDLQNPGARSPTVRTRAAVAAASPGEPGPEGRWPIRCRCGGYSKQRGPGGWGAGRGDACK